MDEYKILPQDKMDVNFLGRNIPAIKILPPLSPFWRTASKTRKVKFLNFLKGKKLPKRAFLN
jgi:hypothetical protein